MRFLGFVSVLLCSVCVAEYDYNVNTEILVAPEDSKNETLRSGNQVLPPDNGGNYGDLIYRQRTRGDRVLLSEVVINEVLYSTVIDLNWTVSIPRAQISSVWVLNLERQRAYCLSINVQGGDVQAILRLAPYYNPRVLIQIYGF